MPPSSHPPFFTSPSSSPGYHVRRKGRRKDEDSPFLFLFLPFNCRYRQSELGGEDDSSSRRWRVSNACIALPGVVRATLSTSAFSLQLSLVPFSRFKGEGGGRECKMNRSQIPLRGIYFILVRWFPFRFLELLIFDREIGWKWKQFLLTFPVSFPPTLILWSEEFDPASLSKYLSTRPLLPFESFHHKFNLFLF